MTPEQTAIDKIKDKIIPPEYEGKFISEYNQGKNDAFKEVLSILEEDKPVDTVKHTINILLKIGRSQWRYDNLQGFWIHDVHDFKLTTEELYSRYTTYPFAQKD